MGLQPLPCNAFSHFPRSNKELNNHGFRETSRVGRLQQFADGGQEAEFGQQQQGCSGGQWVCCEWRAHTGGAADDGFTSTCDGALWPLWRGFCAKFDPNGNYIASGSMDRTIMLWRTFGNCENYGTLTGHKGAIMDLHWSRDSRVLFSASADMHLASWDLETGTRIRRHVGHEEIINTMDISKRGEELLISGSDDGCIGIWDPRTKSAVDFIETEFPITAVALAEAGNEIYSGRIDNDIKVWDMRRTSLVPAGTSTASELQLVLAMVLLLCGIARLGSSCISCLGIREQ